MESVPFIVAKERYITRSLSWLIAFLFSFSVISILLPQFIKWAAKIIKDASDFDKKVLFSSLITVSLLLSFVVFTTCLMQSHINHKAVRSMKEVERKINEKQNQIKDRKSLLLKDINDCWTVGIAEDEMEGGLALLSLGIINICFNKIKEKVRNIPEPLEPLEIKKRLIISAYDYVVIGNCVSELKRQIGEMRQDYLVDKKKIVFETIVNVFTSCIMDLLLTEAKEGSLTKALSDLKVIKAGIIQEVCHDIQDKPKLKKYMGDEGFHLEHLKKILGASGKTLLESLSFKKNVMSKLAEQVVEVELEYDVLSSTITSNVFKNEQSRQKEIYV